MKANAVSVQAAGAVLVAAMRKVVNQNLADENHPCHGCIVVSEFNAPGTYDFLAQRVAATRELAVERDFSATAIYGRYGNTVFRAFHDMDHLLHGLDFTLQDEIEVALLGWNSIAKLVPKHDAQFLRRVYMADTIGQSVYFQKHGRFPDNQTAFVVDYLRTGGVDGTF